MLADSPILMLAIDDYIESTKDVPYTRLVVETWNFDPPKPMADLFESVCGAILVDSNFDLDLVFKILTPVMADVLSVVSPTMPRDPTTELMIYTSRNGCSRVRYQYVFFSGEMRHSAQVLSVEKVPATPVMNTPLWTACPYTSTTLMSHLQ